MWELAGGSGVCRVGAGWGHSCGESREGSTLPPCPCTSVFPFGKVVAGALWCLPKHQGDPPKGHQPCTHGVLQPPPPSHQQPPSAAATLGEATRCPGGTSPLGKALVRGIRSTSVPCPSHLSTGAAGPQAPMGHQQGEAASFTGFPPCKQSPPQPSSSSISHTSPCLMGGRWHSKQCPLPPLSLGPAKLWLHQGTHLTPSRDTSHPCC